MNTVIDLDMLAILRSVKIINVHTNNLTGFVRTYKTAETKLCFPLYPWLGNTGIPNHVNLTIGEN